MPGLCYRCGEWTEEPFIECVNARYCKCCRLLTWIDPDLMIDYAREQGRKSRERFEREQRG
jgi:hypothetical protein